MAASTFARVEGLSAIAAKMRKLSAEVNQKAARQATAAAARVIKKATVAKIVTNPSIDTGSLRDAVIVKKLPKGESEGATSAHIVTFRGRGKAYNKKGQRIARAPHARFVEFGTVNMPAEPMLRPAFDNGKEKALDAMVGKLRSAVDKATK